MSFVLTRRRFLALPAATLAGGAPGWADVGGALFAQASGYVAHPDPLFDGVGNLIVLPRTGVLLATLNRDYGTFRSVDHGTTWTRVARAPLRGRAYGGFSASVDPQTGRCALFMIVSTVAPESALSLDGGRTWRAIARPAGVPHDGWTWGALGWTRPEPRVIVGKQHHDYTALWLSRDAGRSWRKLAFASRNPGVIDANTFVAGGGRDGEGIWRSADGGASWTQVSDERLTGKVPVRWGPRFYWTCDRGVLVTEDGGGSWRLLGAPLPSALWGPHFGDSERSMMVVSAEGLFVTHDGARTWSRVAPFFAGMPPRAGRYDVLHPTVSYGWDARRNMLYCAPVGGSVYRLRLAGA